MDDAVGTLQFGLKAWQSWAPGLVTTDDWQAWTRGEKSAATIGLAPVTFVDPMLRRRLSPLSRMMLSVAHECLQGTPAAASIWANRHGELHTTAALLQQMASGEAMSPMGFSLSVHNSAAGLYAIAEHDCAPATALAAGPQTLMAACIEALGQLKNGREDVLLVYAEEALPEVYSAFSVPQWPALAVAMRLSLPRPDEQQLQVDYTLPSTETATELLRVLLGQSKRCGAWQCIN